MGTLSSTEILPEHSCWEAWDLEYSFTAFAPGWWKVAPWDFEPSAVLACASVLAQQVAAACKAWGLKQNDAWLWLKVVQALKVGTSSDRSAHHGHSQRLLPCLWLPLLGNCYHFHLTAKENGGSDLLESLPCCETRAWVPAQASWLQSLFWELPHCPAKNWEVTNPPLCLRQARF